MSISKNKKTAYKIINGLYKHKNSWRTSLGLLKMKKRISLSSIIKSNAIKSHVKDLAFIIEKLHTYRPCTTEKYKNKDPMWKE